MVHDPSLLEALVAAFFDDGPERTYYYDGDTERVVSVAEDQDDAATREMVWQLEADVRGRFIGIPKPRLEETLEEQDTFVESLPAGPMRKRLEALLEVDPDGSKMARLVTRDREIRPVWREFRSTRARNQANAFLSRLEP